MKKWTRPIPEQALDLQNLCVHLQQPLAEDEKVPISQDQFDWLSKIPSSVEYPEFALSVEEAKTLFRVSEDECTRGVERILVGAIESNIHPSGSRNLFHGTWDNNISHILRLILPDSESVRNGTSTSPALKWPNYGLLIKNHCIVRGEEKGSESGGDPKRELLDKLRWTYQPLPYILGLLWIWLSLKAFLCICYRLSCNYHARPLCCNYSTTIDN
jgi:hypothetical protein